MRTCRTCNIEKDINEFNWNGGTRRKWECRVCSNKEYEVRKISTVGKGKASDDWMKCERRDQTHNRAYEELDNGIY